MNRFVLWLSSILGVLATIATITMMIAIIGDVAARGITGASVPGLFELGETVLVAAVFLGMAYTGATNGHIAVDLLTERLPAAVARLLVLIGWVLTVAILTWLIYATTVRALASTKSNEMRMGLVNWPLWPGRWLIVVGLAAMLLVAVVNVIRLAMKEEVLGYEDAAIDGFDPQLTGVSAANDPIVINDRAETDSGDEGTDRG